MALTLLCNACRSRYGGQFEAEAHSAKTGHLDFVEVTEASCESRDIHVLGQYSTSQAEAADAGGKGAHGSEKSRSNRPVIVMTEEEILSKQERLKEVELSMQKEKDRREEEIQRIRRNIETDRLRQKHERLDGAKRQAHASAKSSSPQLEILTHSVLPSPSESANFKAVSTHAYTRLKLRLPDLDGTIEMRFPTSAKLSEVAAEVLREKNILVTSFIQANFPKNNVWREEQFDMTLKDAGLLPTAALTLKEKKIPQFFDLPSTRNMGG